MSPYRRSSATRCSWWVASTTIPVARPVPNEALRVGRRLIVGTAAVLVVFAGAGHALSSPRTVTLTARQVRWFLPTELRAHDLVACMVGGREIDAKVPPAKAGQTVGADRADGDGGRVVSLEVKANGAVEVRCGAAAREPLRRQTYPYIVGRNGLGLIRGPNTLGRIRKLYGDGIAGSAARTCRVSWSGIGLTASFAERSCVSGSLLVSATVTGKRWSSLSGVHIGDPVARMVWQDQTAKLLSRVRGTSTWLLGGVGSRHHSSLFAVSRGGKEVTSLTVATL